MITFRKFDVAVIPSCVMKITPGGLDIFRRISRALFTPVTMKAVASPSDNEPSSQITVTDNKSLFTLSPVIGLKK